MIIYIHFYLFDILLTCADIILFDFRDEVNFFHEFKFKFIHFFFQIIFVHLQLSTLMNLTCSILYER